MRYLCLITRDESRADPPRALLEAMGLYGAADTVECRVRAGSGGG